MKWSDFAFIGLLVTIMATLAYVSVTRAHRQTAELNVKTQQGITCERSKTKTGMPHTRRTIYICSDNTIID